MKLFTKQQYETLIDHGKKQDPVRGTDDEIDFKPVVKLFTPDAGCTWLLSEIDPDNPDITFGLCDLGLGCAELGNVSITELRQIRGKLGLPVERDRHWTAKKTLLEYAREAWKTGYIVP